MNRGTLMVRQQIAGLPEVQPRAGVELARQLISFEFFDEHLAGEEDCARQKVSAEDLPLGIAEKDMDMDERFSVPYAHISVQRKKLHPAVKLDGIVDFHFLIVVSDHCMRGRADRLNPPETDVFLLHNLSEALIQVGAVRELSQERPFYDGSFHRSPQEVSARLFDQIE